MLAFGWLQLPEPPLRYARRYWPLPSRTSKHASNFPFIRPADVTDCPSVRLPPRFRHSFSETQGIPPLPTYRARGRNGREGAPPVSHTWANVRSATSLRLRCNALPRSPRVRRRVAYTAALYSGGLSVHVLSCLRCGSGMYVRMRRVFGERREVADRSFQRGPITPAWRRTPRSLSKSFNTLERARSPREPASSASSIAINISPPDRGMPSPRGHRPFVRAAATRRPRRRLIQPRAWERLNGGEPTPTVALRDAAVPPPSDRSAAWQGSP